jgi:hypothetical protein
MTIDNSTAEQVLRDRAVKQLKKRRDFYSHLVVYVLFNAFLVVIWAVTGPHGFFWPVFLIVAWGIGLVLNAWDVYGRPDFREDEIRREMDRLAKHG